MKSNKNQHKQPASNGSTHQVDAIKCVCVGDGIYLFKIKKKTASLENATEYFLRYCWENMSANNLFN